MLLNGEWEIVVYDDHHEGSLMAGIEKAGSEIAQIKIKNGTKTITWFETSENIEIPLDWFLKALQEAEKRVY